MQSLARAFAILEAMADAGGEIGLSQLATEAQLPPATIHRLVRTLVDLGYVRQEPSRQYSLGPRLMRLVDTSTKRLETLAHPYMSDVVDALGESVNLAVLDGEEIVYVAQVQPSQNFMRMFTEVGRRVKPHATAVGKAILATKPDDEVRELLKRTGMPQRTEHTLTTPKLLFADLERVRERGIRARRRRAGAGRALRRARRAGRTPANGALDVRTVDADVRRRDRQGRPDPPQGRREDRRRARRSGAPQRHLGA